MAQNKPQNKKTSKWNGKCSKRTGDVQTVLNFTIWEVRLKDSTFKKYKLIVESEYESELLDKYVDAVYTLAKYYTLC